MTLVRVLVLCLALLAAVPLPGTAAEPAEPAKPEAPAPADAGKLKARIAELVVQLGDKEWAKREAASEALLEIGRPAEAALTAAAAGQDAEAATRAAELLKKIKALPERKPIDPNCTDGYQPLFEGVKLVQTFKAPAATVESVRLRVARTVQMPGQNLTVELREPGKDKGDPLASGTADASLIDVVGGRTLTRYYQWITVDLKAEKLEKGKTYQLVLTAETASTVPWLVNCFYRDAYPDGELTVIKDDKPVASKLKFDLVFEVLAGEAKATSVPKDADLTKKDEHFGVGPDGTDLYQAPPAAVPLEGGGAL
jgi:hypothetical protein